MALLLSEANHYLAIAEDPPDANYKTLTTVEPADVPAGHNDSALGNATADALGRSTARPRSTLRCCTRSSATRARRPRGTANGRSCTRARRGTSSRRCAARPLDHRRARRAQEHGRRRRGRPRPGASIVGARSRPRVELGADRGRAPDAPQPGAHDNQIAELETETRGYAYSEGFNVDSASLLAALDECRAAHAATAAALDTAYDSGTTS